MFSGDIKTLKVACGKAKELLLKLHFEAKSGHVGSSLSCSEILSFLKFFCCDEADVIILSKGHAASALYSILCVAGDISSEELLSSYYRDDTLFSAHPPPNKLPSIPFASGSLGHGAGIAAGLALGNKLLENPDKLTFCVLSDGELNEGSTWEAFAFAAHHKLSNLIFVIDQNNIQGFGRTSEVLDMAPISDKLRSFGLAVGEADGHDFESLISSYNHTRDEALNLGRPCVVVAKTVKGRGLGELADTVACHYLPMTKEVYEAAVTFCRTEARSSST
jgi:transketolase